MCPHPHPVPPIPVRSPQSPSRPRPAHLEVADDAVGLGLAEAAGGGGGEAGGAADEQVAGGGVAAPLGAAVAVLGFLRRRGAQRCAAAEGERDEREKRERGRAGRPEPPRRAVQGLAQPAVPRRRPERSGAGRELPRQQQRYSGRRPMAGGSHRRDGTGRDGTGLPLHAAAESCCSVCSTQAPQLPAAPGERLRAAGRPPALLLLRPAAPAGPGRAGPPHTVPPSPAPRPGAARPRRSARPGGGSTEKRLPSRRGSPAGVGGWGRAGRRRAGEGDARPAATGEPRGESGDTPACPPPPPGCALPAPLQLWEQQSGGGGSPMGRPLSLPQFVGKQRGNGVFDPILPSAGGVGGAGRLGGVEGWMADAQPGRHGGMDGVYLCGKAQNPGKGQGAGNRPA